MNFEEYRIENLVKYIGDLREYQNHIGKIVNIETLNGEASYELEIHDSKSKQSSLIRAYSQDIQEIFLKADFLLGNGFELAEEKTYRNKDISLLKIDFATLASDIYGRTNGIQLEDKGYGVIMDKIEDYTSKDGILSKVQLLNSVHSLQNFYHLYLNKQFIINSL
jgi:hypothetical protein